MKANLLVFPLCLMVLVACNQNPPQATLPRPEAFSATVGSSTAIGLSWRKVAGATEYQLERKTGSGPFSPLVTLPHEEGGPLEQRHTDTGLAPGTRYTYRIRAVNARAQSDWSSSAEVETPAMTSTQYQVRGSWLGARNANLYLTTDRGVNYSAATVRINGTTLTYRNPPGSYFASSIPGASAGTVLQLEIEVPEGLISASATIPETPSIAEPRANASVRAGQPLTVTWEYPGPDPDRFYLQLVGNGPTNYAENLPGTLRSHTIPGERVVVPTSGRVFLYLYAVNDGQGSFSGPALPNSQMGVAAWTSVEFDIVP